MHIKLSYFRGFASLFLCFAILGLAMPACSRKSGCPAEEANTQVDKSGMPKSGKTTSGLLPTKGSKKKK